jgi:hypothetical protein
MPGDQGDVDTWTKGQLERKRDGLEGDGAGDTIGHYNGGATAVVAEGVLRACD